jgi:hypothetical protein
MIKVFKLMVVVKMPVRVRNTAMKMHMAIVYKRLTRMVLAPG